MGFAPLAFSVHHFINSVGADAGFAAIIGLAVLVLLYFAHARETASLREQIYEWAQRVQQLEARVTQLSRQQASLPTPEAPIPAATMSGDTRAVPAASGAAAASATVAAAAAAAAPPASATARAVHAPALAGPPAGVAAPALTAATKLIPTYADVSAQPAAGAGNTISRSPAGSMAQLPPDATAVVAPPPHPATVAGGANGSSHGHDPTPPAVPQGQARGAAGTVPPAPPRMQIRQATPPPGRSRTTPPRNQPQRPQRPRGRRGLVLALLALVAVAIVAVVLVLTSGGGTPHKQASAPRTSSNASSTRHRTTTGTGTAPLKPSSVTVAVLNGTVTSGLAGSVSQKLAAEGYKAGRITTAADQTRTSTEVAYMPGHRRDALLVAKSLNLGPASVQPVDQSTQALACPPALGACTATTVVTLGTDLANIQ